ncbi:MAG: mechanosensitive ion channel family protein [Clostridiales bacterium]|nr:mechanosensitive ion channel family protein [Clostridiales bacterium]
MKAIGTLLKVIAIFIIARVIIRVSNIVISNFFKRRRKMKARMDTKKADTLETLSKSILHYTVYFIAILTALPEFGIRTESILATAGIGGLALGFGAQSLVKDVITGFFILFEDQYAVGDFVLIDEITGTVEEIGLRITKVRGFKGDLNVIPNGRVERVTNYSRGNSLAIVDVDIAYRSDIEKASKVMQNVADRYARQNEDIVEPPNVLGVVNLASTGVSIRLIARTLPMKHRKIERDLRKGIKEAFDAEGIGIADTRRLLIDIEQS